MSDPPELSESPIGDLLAHPVLAAHDQLGWLPPLGRLRDAQELLHRRELHPVAVRRGNLPDNCTFSHPCHRHNAVTLFSWCCVLERTLLL